jgi:TM2 domain-containing membrane protein YozV
MKREKTYLVFLLAGMIFLCTGLCFAGETEEERLPPHYVTRLSIIPGMGQFYNKKRTKAWTIIGLEVGAIAGTLVMHDYQIDAYRDWEAVPEGNSKKRSVYRKRLEDLRRARNTFIWLGGLLWIYNITDAYVDAHFYKFDQRKRESEKGSFYILPEGDDLKTITLRWEKYF